MNESVRRSAGIGPALGAVGVAVGALVLSIGILVWRSGAQRQVIDAETAPRFFTGRRKTGSYFLLVRICPVVTCPFSSIGHSASGVRRTKSTDLPIFPSPCEILT